MDASRYSKLRSFFARYTEDPPQQLHYYIAFGSVFSLFGVLFFSISERVWFGICWLLVAALYWYLAYVCWRKTKAEQVKKRPESHHKSVKTD